MPSRRSKRPVGPPPLLVRLYGEGSVVCLRELLLRLGALSREAAPLAAALFQPHDHPDYSQVGGRFPPARYGIQSLQAS